jgi:hypothetical protein
MKWKKTEIAIEIEELIRVVSHRQAARAWCPACGSEALMATPQQAAAIAGSSVRAVNRSVEANRVHFLETPEGLLLVCVNSLSSTSSGKLEVRRLNE